ncbi:MAG: ferrochelatase [Bacteroidota bacterium]
MPKKTAVILFQLGGPDSLEAVEPFLFNLFSDPDIIDFPFAGLARKPLARFIASRRKNIAGEHYREIGGKSPILDLTRQQASALQRVLDRRISSKVFVAMRYWHPLTDAVAKEVKAGGFDEIVLLPMYPHYSITTSGSSINEWKKQSARIGLDGTPQKQVDYFYANPKYIDALVENITGTFRKFSGINPKDIRLVFSAHGVPVSIIKKGDPYQRHIEDTVRLVTERGKWGSPHLLCYQSKVGPAEWLKPSLHNTIHSLAGQGVKNVLIVPLAFVTEHIETLHEINIETREEAHKLGIERFEMMPALNSHPKFIEGLADEVMKKVEGERL